MSSPFSECRAGHFYIACDSMYYPYLGLDTRLRRLARRSLGSGIVALRGDSRSGKIKGVHRELRAEAFLGEAWSHSEGPAPSSLLGGRVSNPVVRCTWRARLRSQPQEWAAVQEPLKSSYPKPNFKM